jgi:hypothetical protein
MDASAQPGIRNEEDEKVELAISDTSATALITNEQDEKVELAISDASATSIITKEDEQLDLGTSSPSGTSHVRANEQVEQVDLGTSPPSATAHVLANEEDEQLDLGTSPPSGTTPLLPYHPPGPISLQPCVFISSEHQENAKSQSTQLVATWMRTTLSVLPRQNSHLRILWCMRSSSL